MMARGFPKKVDANQSVIVARMRKCGAVVDIVSSLPGLGYDLVVKYAGQVRVVEVKDGSKPPSARRLTESERKALGRWESHYRIVISEHDAVLMLCEMAGRGIYVE